ncbi:MAG TPA: hypothetical protein VFV62_10965, partial [Gaiellaceae bacterium]|nr:hypothetical protein [Gaiellaceae bacterium]
VHVDAHVRLGDSSRTLIHRGDTTLRLRPDLTVAAVEFYRPCPTSATGCLTRQTLTTQPVDVVASVKELNGETGAAAEVELMLGPTPVAEAAEVSLVPGGMTSIRFEDVRLTTAATVELSVVVDGAEPGETDVSNNTRVASVEVTEHELVRSTVLVPALAGYGLQFNHHVYAPITPWPHDEEPEDDYDSFEEKAVALQPHIVRIFYNDNWAENKDNTHPEWRENYASFVRAVALAQEAGAIIDISFQTIVTARKTPEASMATFADVLEDLVVANGLTNVKWAEVGNELNSASNIPIAEYEVMVRALDAQLVVRGLDDQIGLMGPGLVENAGSALRNHYEWSKALATSMGDVFDAWGEHVYWNYNDAGRLEYRLRDTRHLMSEELPLEQRKPVYLMEFGIRGLGVCGTNPTRANTYYAADPTCPEIWRTRIAGFQQFWFAIGSAQLGFTGAAKWDAYWGVYDRTLNPPQVYWTIGPPTEGSPLTPTYYALALLFHTTAPGWQVVQVDPFDESDWGVPTYGVEGHSSKDTPEKELAAYTGPSGELTILGLDTKGRALNGLSAEPPSVYSIGGLPAGIQFTLAVWNASGNGENSVAGTVTTDAAGVARFEVPLHAAFSLTTVPVS